MDGTTGCFWSGGPRELARAVVEFEDRKVEAAACVGNAARFDASVFRRRMLSEVDAALREGPRTAAERGRGTSDRQLRSVAEGR